MFTPSAEVLCMSLRPAFDDTFVVHLQRQTVKKSDHMKTVHPYQAILKLLFAFLLIWCSHTSHIHCVNDGAHMDNFYPVAKWKVGSVFWGTSRFVKIEEQDERRWMSRVRGGETIKMLKTWALEGAVRSSGCCVYIYKQENNKMLLNDLFFHYLHLPLRLIGRSMQTCKQREDVRQEISLCIKPFV